MPTKPKLNIRLLRRIQKAILDEPKQFYMNWWVTNKPYEVGVDKIPNCGTAMCIGGWAVALSKKKKPSAFSGYDKRYHFDFSGHAKRAIGAVYGDTLFCDDKWPQPFNYRFANAKTPKQRAKVAVARIEHLIKTGI